MRALFTFVILILISAEDCFASHGSDGMTPSQKPKTGWFGGRRGSESHGKDTDVLKTSAMHSFTGVEGIDHTVHLPPADEKKNTKTSKPEPKKVEKVTEEEQQRLKGEKIK